MPAFLFLSGLQGNFRVAEREADAVRETLREAMKSGEVVEITTEFGGHAACPPRGHSQRSESRLVYRDRDRPGSRAQPVARGSLGSGAPLAPLFGYAGRSIRRCLTARASREQDAPTSGPASPPDDRDRWGSVDGPVEDDARGRHEGSPVGGDATLLEAALNGRAASLRAPAQSHNRIMATALDDLRAVSRF